MDIKQIKQARPEWSTLSDSQVVDMVHQLDYPDLPKEQVAKALGVALEAPAAKPMAGRGVTGWARDLGLSALKGAIAVPEAAVGLADIATGGRAGKKLEELGYRPAEARAILDDLQTDQAKQASAAVQNADGVMGTLGAVIDNPSVIPQAIVESAPLMVGGAGVARGLMRVAPRMGVLGAAATGEGIVSAGSSAEQIRQQTADGLLTGEQAGLAATIGALTGGLGALGGKIAKKLGIGDIDTMIARGSVDAGVRKGVVRSTLEGAVSEGLLEELPQSVQEQALQNLALGKPIDEGVDQAAVLGALTGAAMGGGAGAIARPKVQNNGPLSRGANLALDQMQGEAQALRQAGAPGLSQGQEDQAMSNILAQGDADMQAIKQAGIRDKGPSLYPNAPGSVAGAAPGADPLNQTAEPFDQLGDRILVSRQTLDDAGNRDAIRSKFGQTALDEVLYYLNQADRPGQIPDQTRENMLALAEEIISRSRLSPVQDTPAVGMPGFSPAGQLGAGVDVPMIGLDTAPTGVMRADARGNVAPETNADAISTRQAQSEAKGRGGRGMDGQTPRDTMRGAGPGVMVGEGTLTTPERPRRQQPAAGPVPRLVYRPNGEPFKNQRAAVLEQRRVGGDVVPVDGGWAVQTQGEADDVRGSQTLPTAERPGSGGAPDAGGGVDGNGRVPSDGGVAVNDGGRNASVRDGNGSPSASAVADGATGRGIGEALNEQAQPATPAAPKTQAPQEAADPRGAGQAGAGEQGGGVPRAGGRADAQADGVKKTPDFLKTKTVPQMTDDELRQAAEFYGPEHKRAKAIEKEMGKRAPKVPAVAEPKPSAPTAKQMTLQDMAKPLGDALRKGGWSAFTKLREQFASNNNLSVRQTLDLSDLTRAVVGVEFFNTEYAKADPEKAGRVAHINGEAPVPPAGLSEDQKARWLAAWDEGKARKDEQEPVKARQAGEVVGEATEVKSPKTLPTPKKAKMRRQHPEAVRGSRALAAISNSLDGLSPKLLPDLSEKVQRTRYNKATGKTITYTVWDNPPIPGVGPLFRTGGTADLSEVARVLETEGFLTEGSIERDPAGAAQQAESLIKAEMRQGGSTLRIGDDAAIEAEFRARQEVEMGDPWDDFTFEPEDLDAVGYTDADDTIKALAEQLIAEAEGMGIDTEAVREDAARAVGETATEEDYHAATQEAIRQAITQAQQDAGRGNAGATRESNPDGSSPAEQASRAGSQGRASGSDQEGLSLTAPTRADIEAQQDRTEQADELGAREQARRESEAGAGSFQLTMQEGRQDDTGDLFSQPEPEAKAPATKPPRPEELIAARKRLSVLESLRGCLG